MAHFLLDAPMSAQQPPECWSIQSSLIISIPLPDGEHPQKKELRQALVAYTSNPSYLGGRDWKDQSWRLAQAKSS
jgi:hypothetical protein